MSEPSFIQQDIDGFNKPIFFNPNGQMEAPRKGVLAPATCEGREEVTEKRQRLSPETPSDPCCSRAQHPSLPYSDVR